MGRAVVWIRLVKTETETLCALSGGFSASSLRIIANVDTHRAGAGGCRTRALLVDSRRCPPLFSLACLVCVLYRVKRRC